MRWTVFIALCLISGHVVTSSPRAKKASLHEPTGKIVSNEYIIVFEEDVTDEIVREHLKSFEAAVKKRNFTSFHIMHEYHLGSFRGYSARMDEDTLEEVLDLREVSFVEKNQEVTMDECYTQQGGSWGLGRTTSRKPLMWNEYTYSSEKQGKGVDVYVIDTGIETFHYDFGGRAYWGVDMIDYPSPKTDMQGHGTHVAGTILGDRFGIAKKATAISVRVLNQNGSGTHAGIIAGVNWVGLAYEQQGKRKSIANMSLGGGRSEAGNKIVAAAIAKGIHFSVAAGNSRRDACEFSPASTPEAVTVAASAKDDTFAGFSNWGRCVDVIAPGVNIPSAWLAWGTKTISGTSMAAPHVAGIMAKKLSATEETITPAEMQRLLVETATKDEIRNVPDDTPNKLVFMQCR